VQSFGTYDTQDDAAKAFDLGTILVYGTDRRLNNIITTYLDMDSGKFLDTVEIPEKVVQSAQVHLSDLQASDMSKFAQTSSRIQNYFKPGKCPKGLY
jgi:hypothetical protein